MIGIEFQMDRRAVKSRIVAANLLPGEDGKFGSADVKKLFLSDRDNQKLREITERADGIALKNAKSRGELMATEIVYQAHEPIFSAMREVIRGSNLSTEDKNKIFAQLRALDGDELAKFARTQPQETRQYTRKKKEAVTPDGKQ